MDEIATLWAENSTPGSEEMVNASNLAREYLEEMLPPEVGYRLIIEEGMDRYDIYNSTNNPNRTSESDATVSTHSTRVLVGYGKGTPTVGYVADASLSAIKARRSSSYVYFGGFVGQGNITRILTLPPDADIKGGYMELNVITPFNLYINDQKCDGPSPGGSYTPLPGNMTATNWTLDKSCFPPGENELRIDINFTGPTSNITNNFIGGGYIRVDYETNDTGITEDYSTYWFPGIKGIINLYSSFYVPGPLYSISAYLHYDNNITNATVYLTVANTTVFSSNATGEQKITLTNDNFTSKGLDINTLGKKTVPIRMGSDIENLSIIVNRTADIVLVTDTSGSMEFCSEGQNEGCCQMVPDTCSVGSCSYKDRTWNDSDIWATKELLVHGYRWNSTCDGIEKKIDIAKNASKIFVDSAAEPAEQARAGGIQLTTNG